MSFFFGGPGGMGGMPGGGSSRQQRQKEVDNTKYYDLLEVAKDASEDDIKRAFKKAALKHHPDRGGDPAKFQEVQTAYEVLGDPEKRKLYDEGGEDGLEGGGGMDVDDIFGMFGGGGGRRKKGAAQKQKGEDVVFPMAATLEELYKGAQKKLKLTRTICCSVCKGKGGKSVQTCGSCKGQGVRMVIRQIGPGMITQMQQTCPSCQGQGQTVAEKDKCKSCDGEKTVKESKTLDVRIPRGAKHGTKLTYHGEADELPDTVAGDVIVVIQQKEHPTYKRQSHHLFMKKKLTLVEALCGYEFVIQKLDKSQLLVKCPASSDIINTGDFRCVEDGGMPMPDSHSHFGNLYIEFEVEFPKNISADMKQKLIALLPKAPAMEKMDGEYEEVEMKKVDMAVEKARIQEELELAKEEEDEERRSNGGGGGGGGPQCRQA